MSSSAALDSLTTRSFHLQERLLQMRLLLRHELDFDLNCSSFASVLPYVNCSTGERRQSVRFVISIKSGGSAGFARRQAVRETWMPWFQKRGDCVLFFYVSNHTDDPHQNDDIVREQQQYRDLVFFSHLEERYNLLTYKLHAAMQYAYLRYNFSWFLQADDDTMLNPWLLDEIVAPLPTERCFTGMFLEGSQVIHDTGHRNHEPEYRDCKVFPPYPSGGTAIVSFDLIQWVASFTSQPRMTSNDDVAMGVWFAAVDGVQRRMLKKAAYRFYMTGKEDMSKYFLVKDSHVQEMRPFWAQIMAKYNS
jgi:hypothetical protein